MDEISNFSYQRFDDRQSARSAFDTGLETARRNISIYDRDGEFYGLQRPEVAASFEKLLRASRDTTIHIIVQRPEFIAEKCPRIVNVLGTFSPRIQILKLKRKHQSFERGFVLVDKSVVMRRPHFDRKETFWDVDEIEIAGASRLFMELFESATVAVSSGTTGL